MKNNIDITIPDEIEILRNLEENISKINCFSNCFSASFVSENRFVYCNIYKSNNKVIMAPTLSIKNNILDLKENNFFIITITNFEDYKDVTLIIENVNKSIEFNNGENTGDGVWEFKISKQTSVLKFSINGKFQKIIPIALTAIGKHKTLKKRFATTCDINLPYQI